MRNIKRNCGIVLKRHISWMHHFIFHRETNFGLHWEAIKLIRTKKTNLVSHTRSHRWLSLYIVNCLSNSTPHSPLYICHSGCLSHSYMGICSFKADTLSHSETQWTEVKYSGTHHLDPSHYYVILKQLLKNHHLTMPLKHTSPGICHSTQKLRSKPWSLN